MELLDGLPGPWDFVLLDLSKQWNAKASSATLSKITLWNPRFPLRDRAHLHFRDCWMMAAFWTFNTSQLTIS
jgi:hypothetical protein